MSAFVASGEVRSTTIPIGLRGWEAMISFANPTPASSLLPAHFSPLHSHRLQGQMWDFGTSRPSRSPSDPFKDLLFGLMPDQSPMSGPSKAIFTQFTGFTGFPYLLNFWDDRGDRAIMERNMAG
jgi:hypothetical protein